jgi:hypothetical protein
MAMAAKYIEPKGFRFQKPCCIRITQRPPSKTSSLNPAIHAKGNLNNKKRGNTNR